MRSEVAATKAAWPLIDRGLPANAGAGLRKAVRAATEHAAALSLPGPFEEHEAATLTGPGSPIAGLFRSYSILTARGWQLIGAALAQSERGSAAAARFARANVALYIESVYDAHFSLAQIGKKLRAAYKTLGASAAFGSSLTPSEVDALASTFSEANDRLHPHAGVRLGSCSSAVTAGAGFLLAVLWFDLMFDVQVLGHGERELPEQTLASIAGYYRRVTTAARPMNRLVALAMLATLAAIVVEITHGDGPTWAPWASLALTVPPIALAGGRTVPSAVRLGTRAESNERQSARARSICREHAFCVLAISALLAVQLAFVA